MITEDNKFKKNINESSNNNEAGGEGILKQLKSRAIKIILDVQNKGEGGEQENVDPK
jgi:hypothetical protein